MRVSVLNFRSEILLRGAALGLIAGFASGCSSDFARFAPTGSDYTGSINQRQIINKQNAPANQAFPDQNPVATAAPEDQGLYNEPVYSGAVQADGSIRPVASTIQRKTLAPVAGASTAATSTLNKLPAPSSPARKAVTAQPFPEEIARVDAMEPVVAAKTKVLKTVEPVDRTVTTAITKAKPVVDAAQDPTLVASKATQVVKSKVAGGVVEVTSGQTISGMAARYGVPASAILAANGMDSPNDLKIGQKLIIPGTAAPKTAKPVKTVAAAPIEDAPAPMQVPVNENVAVLPNVPQVRTKQVDETNLADGSKATSNVDKPGFKVIAKKSATAAEQPEAAPVKVAAKVAKGSYAVASGDSLYTIAKRNGTTVEAIKAANGLADGKLKIGQELKIPAAGATIAAAKPAAEPEVNVAASPAKKTAVVAEAPVETDKVETAAVKPATPSKAVIEEAEKDTAEAPGGTGISKLRWPVRGRTLVGYGQADGGKANDGVDISVPNGTPVKSAENGVVIYAGTGLKDYGNTVLVRHDNGLVTVYGHNGNILVKRGQTVKRGQELAKSGMSGNTKVPKLHFEVRKDSTPVNPATLLE
ncbi:MAG: peptidoglycan DD-metalloendopeptidase family protein [Rhizobiaceae bacterium]